ncbi:MAG: alanine--tRNA ligase [Spirochaetes bacterium]|nr:MAG: alanine--tRNA ligase [Spirochaetota bacterium]
MLVKKSFELRESFLNYFKEKGHAVVRSSKVIPENDPTLLFTNAGMNQFKNYFLGIEEPQFKRACSVQKCIRASGKHNDLEDVGKDGRHHTFFEMLGNWSFGDYYKREAIEWAWEFVTEYMGLDRKNLWVSIYRDDEEAYNIWLNNTGVERNRIIRLGNIEEGDEENFWSMGETGPCGPCSEIYYDYSPEIEKSFNEGEKSGEIIELWNLVFMEYNRLEDGTLENLPAKNIDTGMGLERATAVLQGVKSNYETDLFIPIIRRIEEITSVKMDKKNQVSFQVIADHIRALSFAIADGVLPSNEGRGYVIRRILRRAVRHGRLLGMDEAFLYRIVDSVVEIMGNPYPELREAYNHVKNVIYNEEELFLKTLDRGLDEFNRTVKDIKNKGGKVFPGKGAFILHDTYGFPLDLTRIMAEEEGLILDESGFYKEMDNQRVRSQKQTKFKANFDKEQWIEFKNLDKTVFTGYDTLVQDGMRIVRYKKRDDTYYIIFDVTPFYAESGGQVGDRGVIESKSAKLEVIDVKKMSEYFVHLCKLIEGDIRNVTYTGRVDEQRRRRTMANHTATHLLHYALRNIVDRSIVQAGSLVAPDRLRFDFNHYGPVPEEKLEAIENLVNEIILKNLQVNVYSDVPIEEAKKMGAVALFGEKYGEKVRVVEVEGISREFCGGTHVRRTGDIGPFKILKESSVATGIRRIEAITNIDALKFFKNLEMILKRASNLLKSSYENIPEKIQQLEEKIAKLENELKKSRKRSFVDEIEKSVEKTKAGDYEIVHLSISDSSVDEMREISDKIKNSLNKGVVLITSSKKGSDISSVLLAANEKAVMDGVHAGNLLREILKECGGKGGGRPHLAQGGGCKKTEIGKVINLLKKKLENVA